MSKLSNLINSLNKKTFNVYSAINIPTKLTETLRQWRGQINSPYNAISLKMNSNVMLEQDEFEQRVKDCDAIVCSSFGHLIDKKLLNSAGNNLKVFFFNLNIYKNHIYSQSF